MSVPKPMSILLRNAVLPAITIMSGLCLQAQSPTYWLATVERTPTATTYTYNLQAPDYFVSMMLDTKVRGGGLPNISKTFNGKTYTFLQRNFAWDTGGSSQPRGGQIRLDLTSNRQTGEWKNEAKLKADQPLLKLLDSASYPTGLDSPWRYADLLVLRWDDAGAPNLTYREDIPELTQLMNRMIAFNDKPTKAGSYFPNVQVPADLNAFYQLMLAYGNTGRRDPDFRKKHPEVKTASDLSGPTVRTLNGQEKVFRQNQTPPYFAQHVMNEKLNAAAQFHAEYMASIDTLTHDGPPAYKGPLSGGAVKNLTEPFQRAELFGADGGVVEAAGLGGPGDYPEGWMHSDTHFRPWFNVDGCYPEIGFGAALRKRGTWFFVAVPRRDPNCSQGNSGTITTAPVPATAVSENRFPLRPGTKMLQGQKYRSESGNHYLVFQPDGNVVLYNAANQYQWGLQSLTPNYRQSRNVVVQPDGNFVVYGENNAYIWSAFAKDPDPSAFLTLTPEGVLRMVSGNSGATLWASDKNLTPAPAPVQTSPLVLKRMNQYAIRQPNNTFRYVQFFLGRTNSGTFQNCGEGLNDPVYELTSLDTVMRVADALAQGLKASGQPCDVGKAPFGK